MLHTEMVCLRGNDRNLYLVISVALSQNPIPNEKTHSCTNRLHTDTHMAHLHTLHLRTAGHVVSPPIKERCVAENVCTFTGTNCIHICN